MSESYESLGYRRLPGPSEKPDPAWIASRIEMLFSAYRRDDYANPEGFFVQCGEVLSGYSREVIERVTSPKTGIQSSHKFPPNLAEVIEACREAERFLTVMAKPTLPRLPRMPLPRPKIDPETQFETMFQKYGRPLGPNEKGTKWEKYVGMGRNIDPAGFKKPAWREPTDDELRAHYGTRPPESEAAE